MSGPFQPQHNARGPRFENCTESRLLRMREDYEQELNYLARCIDSLRNTGKLDAMQTQVDVYYATQRRLDRINDLLGQ